MLRKILRATSEYLEAGEAPLLLLLCCATAQEAWPGQSHLTMGALTVVDPAKTVKDRVLFTFNNEKDLGRWTLFTDKAFGGKSSATLEMAADQVCSDLQHPIPQVATGMSGSGCSCSCRKRHNLLGTTRELCKRERL